MSPPETCPSLPSLDNNVGDLALGSPTEDLWLYSKQLIRMALELDGTSQDPTSSDLTMSMVYAAELGPVALLMVNVIKDKQLMSGLGQ